MKRLRQRRVGRNRYANRADHEGERFQSDLRRSRRIGDPDGKGGRTHRRRSSDQNTTGRNRQARRQGARLNRPTVGRCPSRCAERLRVSLADDAAG